IKGLTQNATEQDHRFLAPLGRADWVAIADSVREALTDEVIQAAFEGLPGPVFDLHGEELIAIARVRRDKLSGVAEEFYELHSRSVDVVGSNRHETFEVTRVDDESTRVVVYKTTREGEPQQEIFRRVFVHDETDELALYGLGGDDRFIVTGQVREGLTIHAVGGTGEDHFRDDSEVGGRARLTHFLDSRESDWSGGDETRVEVGRRPEDSDYTGHFQYGRTYPAGAAWYNKDDGLVLAGAALLTSQGFQKEPFSGTHRFSGSLATGTGAVRLSYEGTAREALGDWDVGLGVRWANPDNTHNFYGLGNETPAASTLDQVRIRLGQIDASLPLTRESETGLSLGLTPRLTMTDVRDDQRPEDFPQQPGLSAVTTARQWHLGAAMSVWQEYLDDPVNPRQGFKWNATGALNRGLGATPDDYATVSSDLALFTSLRTRRQATMGVRVGGAHSFGTFPFHQANAIGGETNLRGFRDTRFSGRSSFFANAELRLGLLDIGGSILPGTLGAIGFFDAGRVWTDDEMSTRWHQGYGGGLWYDIAGELVIRLTNGWSNEDNAVLFGAGFFF
ncbi:MAG: BamA/TamA family outer membrane protein, partial [Longimicrobiales bacterium]